MLLGRLSCVGPIRAVYLGRRELKELGGPSFLAPPKMRAENLGLEHRRPLGTEQKIHRIGGYSVPRPNQPLTQHVSSINLPSSGGHNSVKCLDRPRCSRNANAAASV